MASNAASGSRTPIQALSGEQQEAIIKQRMQVDERSMRRLVKKFTALLGARDPELLSLARLSFQADLSALQIQLSRLTSIARNTSTVEIHSYTSELAAIELDQTHTRTRIDLLKRRLDDVKRERTHKLEYDLVASEIVALPTRAELADSVGKLREQLARVVAENARYAETSRVRAGRVARVVGLVDALHSEVENDVGERERREVERDGDADGDGDGDGEDADAGRAGAGAGAGDDDGASNSDLVDRAPRSRLESGEEPEEGEQDQESEPPQTTTLSSSRDTRSGAAALLNPSARTFRPTSTLISNSTAASTAETSPGAGLAAAGGSRRKRDSTALVGSDEEGELDDSVPPTSTSASAAAAAAGAVAGVAASNGNTPRKRQRTHAGATDEEGELGESEEEEGSIRPATGTSTTTNTTNKRRR
ncbi:hypothetical protein BCV70DRAFT_199235 [Testicularia cyperi]|uniref:THO complex subunit 7 n=1 Tax=Testicularia cyperi TaxID=1882483 RepID=A0A317XSJ4_9BASI|nr:hypothetical protein BCV70DRAFT_199235 [Testicularia cyperi]